jgi:hypothetical protein
MAVLAAARRLQLASGEEARSTMAVRRLDFGDEEDGASPGTADDGGDGSIEVNSAGSTDHRLKWLIARFGEEEMVSLLGQSALSVVRPLRRKWRWCGSSDEKR